MLLFLTLGCGTGEVKISTEPSSDGDVLIDNDADGYLSIESGGDDCDDSNPTVNTGASELCDGLDNNCNDIIDEDVTEVYFADLDGDGFGNSENTQEGCEAPEGFVTIGSDCDDINPEVYPAADEVCDGVDNDCNEEIDENLGIYYFADFDGDGFGSDQNIVEACMLRDGLSSVSGDCDDNNNTISPIAQEICDELDNDCNELVDDGVTLSFYPDGDGDGYGGMDNPIQACTLPEGYTTDATDCEDSNAEISPVSIELCDGVDNNCDEQIDENTALDVVVFYEDSDGDGYGNIDSPTLACSAPEGFVSDPSDCDDEDDDISPVSVELCDDVDNNCNELIDDEDPNLEDASAWSLDHDGDGYGDASLGMMSCVPQEGYIADGSDCDDLRSDVYPGAAEVCDGIDNNCDDLVDDEDELLDESTQQTVYVDSDGDGYGNADLIELRCDLEDGYAENGEDCDDENDQVYPNAPEYCVENSDIDCDGIESLVDEDAVDRQTWYVDVDGDGFGNPQYQLLSCEQIEGTVANNDDCDDTASHIFPGAPEYCDEVDQDCDGVLADPEAQDAPQWYADLDEDGFGDLSNFMVACAPDPGFIGDSEDCDDTDPTVFPNSHSIEVPLDGIDQDCDGEDVCHDLNCDNWPDIVIPSYRTISSYESESYIYYGAEDGYEPVDRSVLNTNGVRKAKVIDLNSDGYLDIVFIGYYHSTDAYIADVVLLWGGEEPHSMSNATTFKASGAMDVCFSDLNDDGHQEILVAQHYDSTLGYRSESLLLWGSDLGYSTDLQVEYPIAVGIEGDEDCDDGIDNNEDFAVDCDDFACEGSPSCIDQDLDGAPLEDDCDDEDPTRYPGALEIHDDRIDQDCDGYVDITSITAGASKECVMEDLDNDGYIDIYVPSWNVGYSHIYWGNEDNSFVDRTDMTRNYASRAKVRDIDSDGDKDILMPYASGWMSFHEMENRIADETFVYHYHTWDMEMADLNNDGFVDIIACQYDESGQYNTISAIYWSNFGTYSESYMTQLPTYAAHGPGSRDGN